MKKYLIMERIRNGGLQEIYKFPNGYGASVICNPYSFGGDEGLWEIAVLDENGHITYETPITADVIGYLNDDEVIEILNKIKELENEKNNSV